MTSTIKVNTIQNTCGADIIKESSNTITIGASGDTVTLASGASQTGFGRTGTVDWQTTPKTANFTAVNGEGNFVNTTSGTITMTMPSGSSGAIVSIQDYNKTFDTNAFTVTPASGEKINGGPADGILLITTEGQGLTFVYVDSTVGWKTVHENEFTAGGSTEIIATGGTITTCGDCKIHTFTGPGTFSVSQISGTPANNVVSYLILGSGGGGGGGSPGSGGGSGAGAGGFREVKTPVTPYTASPLDGYSTPGNRITLTATAYPIVVGGGGAGGGCGSPNNDNNGVVGNVSSFGGIASAGGGQGRYGPCGSQDGAPGGSGGGASGGNPGSRSGGTGNTPPVSPPQGNNGGATGPWPAPSSYYYNSAGGGGAGGAGGASQPGPRAGGSGATTNITGSPVTYAAGGNGGTYNNPTTPVSAEPNNSGNGGDGKSTGPGGNPGAAGGNGGSGIVVIRYKFQ